MAVVFSLRCSQNKVTSLQGPQAFWVPVSKVIVFSFGPYYTETDVDRLERIQGRAIKMIQGLGIH